MITGEIGTILIKDKQVGGFTNWYIMTEVDSTGAKIKAEANSFWLNRESDKYTIRWYQRLGNRLVIVQEVVCTLLLPEHYKTGKLNKKIIGFVYAR